MTSALLQAPLRAVIVLVMIVVLMASAQARVALASHSEWEHCPPTTNDFAKQYTTNFYHGLFGWMHTYNPSLRDINNQFSLSHLFAYTNGGGSFAEVGWYRGVGWQFNTDIPRYYTAGQDSVTAYDERNISSPVPPIGSTITYEVQYEGFDFGTNKYIWRPYANGAALNPPWLNKDLAMAIQESGGEIAWRFDYRFGKSGTQMAVRVTPAHQINLNGGWNNWNDTFMQSQGDTARTCTHIPYQLQYFHRFDDYVISGTNP